MRHRVADNYGAYNDIQLVDLNNDGRVDILTSVIKRGASRGHVVSYNLPDDFVFGQWKRTVLAAGFDREGKNYDSFKSYSMIHTYLLNWLNLRLIGHFKFTKLSTNKNTVRLFRF